jgi:hypothetical protein
MPLKLLRTRSLAGLGGLLGEKVWERTWISTRLNRALLMTMELTLVNVGKDTTLGDGDVSQKLVQLLIVADGELEMTGNDTSLLVVTSSITGQFEDFGSEVLQNGSEVDGGTLIDASAQITWRLRVSRSDSPAPTRCA